MYGDRRLRISLSLSLSPYPGAPRFRKEMLSTVLYRSVPSAFASLTTTSLTRAWSSLFCATSSVLPTPVREALRDMHLDTDMDLYATLVCHMRHETEEAADHREEQQGRRSPPPHNYRSSPLLVASTQFQEAVEELTRVLRRLEDAFRAHEKKWFATYRAVADAELLAHVRRSKARADHCMARLVQTASLTCVVAPSLTSVA